MSRHRRHSAIAGGALALVVLAGCAPAPTPALAPWAIGEFPTPEPVRTVSPRPTVDTSTLVVGTVIEEASARILNRDVADGFAGYELLDGTFLVVAGAQPLPELVLADMRERAAAAPVIVGQSVDEQRASFEVGNGLAGTFSYQTGRRVVVIHYGGVAFPSGSGVVAAWRAARAPLNAQGLYPIGMTAGAVLAETQALIAKEPNPGEWEIIVQPR